VFMSADSGKSRDHLHLPVVGYGVGLALCMAIWGGIFAGTRYLVKDTAIGKIQLGQLANGLPEGRSIAPRSTECK